MKIKRKRKKGLWLRLCVFAFTGYLAFVLVNLQIEIGRRQEELLLAQQRTEQQRLENKELERIYMLGSDEKYIERVAREKLGFAYPDERILIDVSGS